MPKLFPVLAVVGFVAAWPLATWMIAGAAPGAYVVPVLSMAVLGLGLLIVADVILSLPGGAQDTRRCARLEVRIQIGNRAGERFA